MLIPLTFAASIAASYWYFSSSNHNNLHMTKSSSHATIRAASYDFKDRSQFGSNIHTIMEQEEDKEFYVFLQKFPLQHSFGRIFHTEILVCPQTEFASADRAMLDDHIAEGMDYTEIDESWWEQRSDINCIELGYGGSDCTEKCCSVVENPTYKLNNRVAMITNVETDKKSLFLYGTRAFDGIDAYRAVCNTSAAKCWSHWSGTDYNLFQNNCNTFTSTVLSCVYGLSQKKPDLGVSDMVTVSCQCDVPENDVLESVLM